MTPERVLALLEISRPLTRADILQHAVSALEVERKLVPSFEQLEKILQQMFEAGQIVFKSHPELRQLSDAPLHCVVVEIDLPAVGQVLQLPRVASPETGSVPRNSPRRQLRNGG